MRKLIFVFFTIFFIKNYAVEKDSINPSVFDNKNEIRIDVSKLLANGRLGLSYERILNERITVGVSGVFLKSIHYDWVNGGDNCKNHLQINPFTRFVFYQRPKKLFYAELFVSYTSNEIREIKRVVETPYAYYEYQNSIVPGWGTGAAIGSKFFIYNDISLELSLGGGSTRIGENRKQFINRSSISLGYRF